MYTHACIHAYLVPTCLYINTYIVITKKKTWIFITKTIGWSVVCIVCSYVYIYNYCAQIWLIRNINTHSHMSARLALNKDIYTTLAKFVFLPWCDLWCWGVYRAAWCCLICCLVSNSDILMVLFKTRVRDVLHSESVL